MTTEEQRDYWEERYWLEVEKNKKLELENHDLKEQLQMYIPRRRVRRVYKILGNILRADIDPVLLEKELKKEE